MTFEAREQSPDKFPFKTPEELALIATKLGLGVTEFMKLYYDNLNETRQNAWHTAVRFKAKIVDIAKSSVSSTDENGQQLERVTVKYQHGAHFEKTQTLALNGLLHAGYNTEKLYAKVKKARGEVVLLYRAYDRNKYSVIIELDRIPSKNE